MTKEIDLVEEISSLEKDCDIVFTTYNFDRRFFERELFPRFEDNTIPLILVDYDKYQESALEYGESNLIESKYFIEPVKVKDIFHPKLLVAIKENRIYCFVGSCNLTRSGFTENLEILLEVNLNFKKEEDMLLTADLRKFLEELKPFIQSEPHKKKMKNFISKFPNTQINESKKRESWIISSINEPIFSQVLKKIKGEIKEIFVLSPFFSSSKEFYRSILNDCKKINFIVQQENTDLPKTIVGEFENVNFYKIDIEEERFVHAKFMYIVTEKKNYVCGGSHNFTNSALLTTENIEIGLLSETNLSLIDIIDEIGGIEKIELEEIISNPNQRKESKIRNNKIRLTEANIKENEIKVKIDRDVDIRNVKLIINNEIKNYSYEIQNNVIVFRIPEDDKFHSSEAVKIEASIDGEKEFSDYRLIHNPKYFPDELDELNYLDYKNANWLFNILKKLSKMRNISNYTPVLDEISKIHAVEKDKEKMMLKLKDKINSIEEKEKNVDIKNVISRIVDKKIRNINNAIDNEIIEKDFEVINTFILTNKLILYSISNGYYNSKEGLGEIRKILEIFIEQNNSYLDILLRSHGRKSIIEESDMGYHVIIVSFIINRKKEKGLKFGKVTKDEKNVFDRTIIECLTKLRNKTNIEYDDFKKAEKYLEEYKEIIPSLKNVNVNKIRKDLGELKKEYERRKALKR